MTANGTDRQIGHAPRLVYPTSLYLVLKYCGRGTLSKYRIFRDYLNQRKAECLRLSFSEIENILGFSLPLSARMHQAWWANDATDGRHSCGWLEAGWATEEVDLTGQKVTFRRTGRLAGTQATKVRSVASRDVPSTPRTDAPSLPIDLTLRMGWKHFGKVELLDGKLVFPATPAVPGLYRLRIFGDPCGTHYIGESDNLRRRFGNYRNPGPTQATSLRINAVLNEHLHAGRKAALDIIISDIEISFGGKTMTIDLSVKSMRRLLEQAAIVAEDGEEADILNR